MIDLVQIEKLDGRCGKMIFERAAPPARGGALHQPVSTRHIYKGDQLEHEQLVLADPH